MSESKKVIITKEAKSLASAFIEAEGRRPCSTKENAMSKSKHIVITIAALSVVLTILAMKFSAAIVDWAGRVLWP